MRMALQPWKKLSTKPVFQSPYLSVNQNAWQLPNGKIIDSYMSFERPDYVIMVGADQDGRILFERQFRPAANDFIIEMPAGFIEAGEEVTATAAREFQEETGYPVVSTQSQGFFYPLAGPSAMRGNLVFLRFDSSVEPQHNREEQETLECFLRTPQEAKEMLRKNEIHCLGAIASLSQYLLSLEDRP